MNTKINTYLLIGFSLFLVYSCQTTDKLKRTNANQILLDEEYEKSKTINLDEVATFEFIPLETTDKSLLDKGYKIWHIDNDNIIITNKDRCEVFFFNRTGKLKSSFACKGGGPNEIRLIAGCFWDAQRKELYLNDRSDYNRILVFNEKGKHLRTLRTEGQYSFDGNIVDFDEKSFLAYDQKNIHTQESYIVTQANPYPYVLLSKEDGKKVGQLPFYFPKRMSNNFFREEPNSILNFVSFPGLFPFKKYGDELIVCDIGLDTVYRYSSKTSAAVSLFSKLPELQNQEYPKTLVGLLNYNDKYVTFLRFVNHYDFETNKWAGSREYIVYDQRKKTFYSKSFTHSIGVFWYPFSEYCNPVLPKNTDGGTVTVECLYESFKEGKIKDPKLKQIASKMNEDDNDVLILVHYNNN